LTLRDRPSRKPLDGDITVLTRVTLDGGLVAATDETVNNDSNDRLVIHVLHLRTSSFHFLLTT